ncbi:MAG: hypothetical protein MOGMAGMI_01965 [Candidatus Omnitrophica bacterium]|nr:hypothetical protein [Candidatus Omnitrophota bacterium]
MRLAGILLLGLVLTGCATAPTPAATPEDCPGNYRPTAVIEVRPA